MIVGICGLIGSGKGTVADILVEEHGFRKVSFADSLKDCVAAVFGWPRDLLEGDTRDSREWRETTDAWWADRLGMDGLTPRWVLQQWGTEVCRSGFHRDIWVASLQGKLRRDASSDFVIPDTRFPNEIDALRSLGGSVWHVSRGEPPSWFEEFRLKGIEPSGVHESEWRWATSSFDLLIPNDGSMEDLRHAVSDALPRVRK